jgi:chemotaxis protein methyltransferase CheR
VIRTDNVSAMDPGVLEEAAAVVRRRTGLVFTGARASALESGLRKAMQSVGASDPMRYLSRLDAETGLMDGLVTELTVGETYFFRDAGQWELIRNRILPELMSRRSSQYPIRIWSAGCASGEEPYTAAIVMHQLAALSQVRIIGTDVSRRTLAAARRARYTRWSLRDVPEEITRLYFRHANGRFDLAPPIRQAVEFRYLNLAEDRYPNPGTGLATLDLILCRNVLIYFDQETVARVARQLLDSLSEDGWLILGAADPVLTDRMPCSVEITGAGLAYRRARLASPLPSPIASDPAPIPRVAIAAAAPFHLPPQPKLRPAALRGPPDAATEAGRVRALANRGELLEAGQVCAAALDRHRGSSELAYLHAVLLNEAGRCSEAATAARLALYLDRKLVVAHLALGTALARLEDKDGACRAFRNAQRLLAAVAPDEIVPASDGEPASRLAELTRAQIQLLDRAPPQ